MWHPNMPEEYKNKIVSGDCRELSKCIPDNSLDLAFVDPPYWVGFDYGDKTDKDMSYVDSFWLVNEMMRIAKVAMITPSIGHMYAYPKPTWVIAWYKPAAMGRNFSGGVNSWEPILVYGKPRVDIDVIKIMVHAQKDAAFHTCPKPLDLMKQIIVNYCPENGTVIDFMCGSGTTCKAAKLLGRNYIGFEIDANIAKLANQRLEQTQIPWFIEKVEQLNLV